MSKYGEIMEHIELSEEAKKRILNNAKAKVAEMEAGGKAPVKAFGEISDKTLDGASDKFSDKTSDEDNVSLKDKGRDKDVSTGSRIRKYLYMAACLTMVIAASIFALRIGALNNSTPSKEPDESVFAVPDIKEAASAAELSQMAGIDISDIGIYLTEKYDAEYMLYWGEIAQITYTSDTDSVMYRKAAGNSDISGDYNVYENVENITVMESEVTIKGNNSEYNNAIWTDGDYSYSLYFENGVSKEQIEEVIKSIIEG